MHTSHHSDAEPLTAINVPQLNDDDFRTAIECGLELSDDKPEAEHDPFP
jgi:hypothetical protein